MNVKDAIQIISKEAPCRHDSYESCGFSGTWGKCCDCGVSFPVANKPNHDKSADEFDAAIEFLSALGEQPEPGPQMEPVEVKRWASIDVTSGRIWSFGTKEEMEIATDPSPSNLIKIVELTGTYEVPVKPKVKRREELQIMSITPQSVVLRRFDGLLEKGQTFFAEWTE